MSELSQAGEAAISGVVTVTDRGAVGVVLAPGTLDFGIHQLVQHPEPDAQLSASNPGFAAPTSSPSASCTRTGSRSGSGSSVAADRAETVLTAVGPPVLVD